MPQESIQSEAIRIGPLGLYGDLTHVTPGKGFVVFAHGSGSSRASPRNRRVAGVLHEYGLSTLLFDLLTEDEAERRANVFDIELLSQRVVGTLDWLAARHDTAQQPAGLFGASTGAAAALCAAAERPAQVAAVVSRGGRPDLALQALQQVRCPTLLIVGGDDPEVLQLNRQALAALRCDKRLEVVPGATHLFEEPGALDLVARLAGAWFADRFEPAKTP